MNIKFSTALLIFLLITACGGGSEETDNKPSENQDMLSKYIYISDSFQGLSTDGTLTSETSGIVMSYLLDAAPELLPDYDDLANESGELCPDGGIATQTPSASKNEQNITFINCKNNKTTYNGTAVLRIEGFHDDGEPNNALFIFKDVTVNGLLGESSVRGTIRQQSLSPNCPRDKRTYNLLFSNDTKQVWYNNFSIMRNGAPQYSCMEDDGIRVSGDIVDSDYGRYSFYTTAAFKLKTMQYILKESGSMTIHGAGTKFTWSLKPSLFTRENFSSHKTIHNLELKSENSTQKFRFWGDFINIKMLSDFKDVDNDGMSDGWERVFNLDPNNPDDASAISGSHEHSNLSSFLYLGVPNNEYYRPWVADLSIQLLGSKVSYSDPLHITALLNNHTPNSPIQEAEIILTVESPFTFDTETFNAELCTLSADIHHLTCNINYSGNSQVHWNFGLKTEEETIDYTLGEVTAEVSWAGFDPINTNNISTAAISKRALESNFSISKKEPSFNVSTIIEIGESRIHHFYISQPNTDNLLMGSYANITPPENIKLENLECLVSQIEGWQSCSGDLPFNKESLSLQFKTIGQHEAEGRIKIAISNPKTGKAPLAQWSYPIVVGRNSSQLQASIDAAYEGAELAVEPGVIIGPIYLNKKQISLRGHGQVTLVGSQDRNIHNEIVLDKDSTLSGFNIAAQMIRTEGAGGTITNNTFSGENSLLNNIYIAAYADTLLSKNKFYGYIQSAGWINGSNDICSGVSIINSEYNEGKPFGVTLENNLYQGKVSDKNNGEFKCSFIMIDPESKVTIKHNTIQGVNHLIRLDSVFGEDNKYELLVENNIFSDGINVAKGSLIASSQFVSSDSEFNFENNIWFNIDEFFPQLAEIIPDVNSYTENPQLKESGEPIIGSIAIDSAKHSNIADDLLNRVRPVDGDSDGIVKSDIGAFEVQ